MNYFLRKIILFIILLLFALFCIEKILFSKKIYPIITNSVSFDVKSYFARDCEIDKVDILAFGSSMTLNNLNSQVFLSSLNNKFTFLNLSSWGIQLNEIDYLMKFYLKKYDPKLVILVSSIVDFDKPSVITLPGYFEYDIFYKKYFDLLYIFKNPQIDKLYYRAKDVNLYKYYSQNKYENLEFDKFGGVILDIPVENIEAGRWNMEFRAPREEHISSLQDLSDYLMREKVKLIFVQSPIKKDYYKDKESKIILQSFFDETKKIIENNNNIYINLHDENIYQDSLFCDVFHLNKTAAEFMTKDIIKKINIDSLLESGNLNKNY